MKTTYLLITSILFLFFTSSCGNEEITEPTDPTITIPIDKIVNHSLYFGSVEELYPIEIFVPKEYEDNKNLPVLYLLDGLTVYEGRTFLEDVVLYMEEIELNAILVAIGDKLGLERARDFLAEGCSGGKEEDFNNFYEFITNTVVPYADGRFQSDQTARTLIGFSHGGNFANNAFLREKKDNIIFHNFISVDPSDCTASIIEKQLDNLDFPEGTKFKIHLSKTEFGTSDKIYNAFAAREFDFLELDFKLYLEESHQTVPTPSIKRGLQFIYGL